MNVHNIALSVNVNKIALIRNSRQGNNPNLVDIAANLIDYGAQGITVHPRPDQRHIRPEDCNELANLIARQKIHNPAIEFNIEGNPLARFTPRTRTDFNDYPGFLRIIEQCKPDQVTLVPDHNSQLTSDHGFDLSGDIAELIDIIQHIKSLDCRVSLFMDADLAQIRRAAEIGADRIELYTGPFAHTYESDRPAASAIYAQHRAAANHAHALGLGINAGHDLNLDNILLYRELPHLQEVSIGHAFTIDALHFGFATTTMKYLTALNSNTQRKL